MCKLKVKEKRFPKRRPDWQSPEYESYILWDEHAIAILTWVNMFLKLYFDFKIPITKIVIYYIPPFSGSLWLSSSLVGYICFDNEDDQGSPSNKYSTRSSEQKLFLSNNSQKFHHNFFLKSDDLVSIFCWSIHIWWSFLQFFLVTKNSTILYFDEIFYNCKTWYSYQ